MQLMVDTKGNTYDIEVVDSNGNRFLELAAVRAAKKHKYKPAKFQGKPIDASSALTCFCDERSKVSFNNVHDAF